MLYIQARTTERMVIKMKKKLLLITLVLVALSACTTHVVVPDDAKDYNALNVQGMDEFEAAPDVAKVRLGVTSVQKDAKLAQSENARISNQVRDALLQAGVRKNEIETTNYRLNKRTRWDRDLQRQVDDGYEAVNTVVVTTRELTMVGDLIDVAVRAGSNDVQGISFELSDEKERQVKNEALRRAVQNAREKAVALAQGAQVSLGGIRSIQENSFSVQPHFMGYDTRVMAMAESAAEPTPISPQSVNVRAQVSVTYEVV